MVLGDRAVNVESMAEVHTFVAVFAVKAESVASSARKIVPSGLFPRVQSARTEVEDIDSGEPATGRSAWVETVPSDTNAVSDPLWLRAETRQ